MNHPETDRFATESGIVHREGEPSREFLQRLGEASTANLIADTGDYTAEARQKLIDKYYPAKEGETLERLFANRKALELLAAPQTMRQLRDTFISTARGYVEAGHDNARNSRFMALQRLAGVAGYSRSYDERVEMCNQDVRQLSQLYDKLRDQSIKTGPALTAYMRLDLIEDKYWLYAPARMAVDHMIDGVAPQLGYTPEGAVSRGYRVPMQAALVIDFTRALADLRTR